MRNLISYNPSFIWDNKLKNRNNCISNFNNFYLVAKDQDKLYLKQDIDTTLNSITIELIAFKTYDELRETFPWLSPDSYILLFSLIQIKRTSKISNTISDYNTNHEFNVSSWMGICENSVDEYAHDIPSWENIHINYVMNYSRNQRLENYDYFKKFKREMLKFKINQIENEIKKGKFKYFSSIHKPTETDGNTIHGEVVHIHLKKGGALNINGKWKHERKGDISNGEADDLIKIGFILPENL